MGALKQNHPEKCLKEGKLFCNKDRPCCAGLKCYVPPFLDLVHQCVRNATGNFKRKYKNTW